MVGNFIVSHHGDHGHDHGPKKPKVEHHHEMNLQGIQEHWGHSSTGGKFGVVAGSTLALGVIMHGGLNIKRGLVGYKDTNTGQEKKGSVENLLFGVGETYVGLTMLRRFLVGNTSWALWK